MVARPQLIDTMHLLSRANAATYDIFAHSMGAFLLMETAVQARDLPRGHMWLHLANVMMAAPDIDIDLFRSHLALLGRGARGSTSSCRRTIPPCAFRNASPGASRG
ncbi:MAG TPA: hypothetical protein DEA05_05120 [Rhodobacteraceae bacterium]|nr:hypothetical protein [Paracoccaceae bacterium]